MKTIRRRKAGHCPISTRRRGVLLLLILALLALFGLIAVAFVVISGQAQRSAKSIERMEQVSDPPQKVLQQAAMQVLRGSSSPASAMGTHSLLEDMYGNEYVYGTVSSAATVSTTLRQLVDITLDTTQGLYTNGATADTKVTSSTSIIAELARHVGCVLTITYIPSTATADQQALKGQSTRIVGATTASATIQVIAFANGTLPSKDSTFTINGVPFSGTGFGYNPDTTTGGQLNLGYDITNATAPVLSTSGTLDATHLSVALLPNLPLSIYSSSSAPATIKNVRGNPPGGANSDYTAADFQHLLLAAQVPTATTVQTLPSFHRSALCRYWAAITAANGGLGIANADQLNSWKLYNATTNPGGTNLTAAQVALLRRIMPRPIGKLTDSSDTTNVDHPNFTGSNPSFNPAWDGVTPGQGQWDIDNDGDGVPDSVWVDLGMPVRATSDGRLYKPLFAILCTDLDGRLNVNAHGCPAQTVSPAPAISPPANHVFAGGTTPTSLPHGLGYGPAEIDLSTVFTATGRQTLLTDRYPDAATSPWPGGAAGHVMSLNKWFRYGSGDYVSFPSGANNCGDFGTPPDVAGIGAIGIDWGGRPLYCFMGQKLSDSSTPLNLCPYEFNPSAPHRGATTGPGNLPFGVAELERLLRPYDKDATSLPGRLATVASTSSVSNILQRTTVTTDSSDVPCVSVAMPIDVLTAGMSNAATLRSNLASNGLLTPRHPSDLFKALIMKAGSLSSPPTDTVVASLVASELLAGRKMDLNRAFGNGLDDNLTGHPANDVVDEPAPAETGEQVTLYNSANGTSTTQGAASYDPSGTIASDSLQSRQLYARYLYVLAMLVVDKTGLKASQQLQALYGATPTDADVAQFLAQWAVNVVDFYDRDSIMTPFQYDPTPFVGTAWNAPTGLPTTNTNLVWGCERPELLITETLAFHDRRTEDLPNDDNTAGTNPHKVSDGDTSLDQRYRPQGSLFVELYNPCSDLEPCPNELSTAINGGVNLAKKTPATSGTVCPVWRLAVVGQGDATTDPDNQASPPTLQRTVYFTDSTAPPPTDDPANVKFMPSTNFNTLIAPIMPGRYALIGPGDPGNTTASTTYLGFKTTSSPASPATDERRIVLKPSASATQTGQVEVYNAGTGSAPGDLASVNMNTPTAVVIDSPQRLSISEPTNTPPYPVYPGGNTSYTPIKDVPLDKNTASPPPTEIASAIWKNGRTNNVAVVHLQRLANPLMPYNAINNPYRTIDSMPIDLTAFNGVSTDVDPQANPTTNATTDFWSRQRGANTTGHDLWTQEPLDPASNKHPTSNGSLPTISGCRFLAPLSHTLSYLNDPFGAPNTGDALGDPSTTPPFPWLTWNNRPFISQLELLLVPWAKSSRLCYNYPGLAAGTDPYTDLATPFPRFASFFQSEHPVTAPGTASLLERILEFVNVPSRFAGTDIQIDPAVAATGTHLFHPPFNRIPTYREPGKINLNTIYSREVFNGLMNGSSALTWDNFVLSRRGYAATPQTNVLAMDTNNLPTQFAQPFRSFASGQLVPQVTAGVNTDALRPTTEVGATLLRADTAGTAPLFDFTSASDYNNTARNPFFRYQVLQRLGNLVTTRSNVYAVWITVGYFEVSPVTTPDIARWPDGYQLGRELGTDTGEIERHRAFYIFDRTLPVGFQRGQDLNVEKAVLVNRFIE